jgi:Flp pilus assembly protein TadD
MTLQTRLTAGLLLITAIVIATGWFLLQETDTPDSLQQGIIALRRGDIQTGKELLDQHLQQHPADDSVRLLLADSLMSSDTNQAIDYLQSVTADSDQYATALRQLAVIGIQSGNSQLTEDSLKQLLVLDPQDAGSSLALSELYFHSERFDEALPQIHSTLELQPERAETYVLLADTLSLLGRHAEMVTPLTQAIQYSPELLSAHANLAFASIYAGDATVAKQEAEWCLQRDPELTSVRLVLAKALRDLGDHQQALQQTEQVLQADQDNLEAILLQADILLYQRDAESAYQNLAPLLQHHSENRTLVSHLARAAAMTGRREEARSLQDRLRSLLKESSKTRTQYPD